MQAYAMPSDRVLDELQITAELCGGREFSSAAARAMVTELRDYPEDAVLGALSRCRREVRSLTLADIVSRIEDGRPGPEEAWAMIPHDEGETVVWTPEMREAHAACSSLIADEDMIGARMAFKEAYTRILSRAKAQRLPVRWEVSLGHDSSRREGVVKDAYMRNRISLAHARELLPSLEGPAPLKLIGGTERSPEAAAGMKQFLDWIRKSLTMPAEPTSKPDGIQDTAARAKAELERFREIQGGEE